VLPVPRVPHAGLLQGGEGPVRHHGELFGGNLAGIGDSLRRAVSEATPRWSDAQRAIVAGLPDALWHVPTYERLVGPWNVPAEDATAAITWMMDQVIATVTNDQPQIPSA
jgi:hypothetical protein